MFVKLYHGVTFLKNVGFAKRCFFSFFFSFLPSPFLAVVSFQDITNAICLDCGSSSLKIKSPTFETN